MRERDAVTTAIVQGGMLLLHRSVDMSVRLWREVEAACRCAGRPARGAELADEPAEAGDRFEAEAAMQTSVVETADGARGGLRTADA